MEVDNCCYQCWLRSDGVILTWSIQNRPHSHSSKHWAKYSNTSGGWSSPGAHLVPIWDILLIFIARLASTLMIISLPAYWGERKKIRNGGNTPQTVSPHTTHSARLIYHFIVVVVMLQSWQSIKSKSERRILVKSYLTLSIIKGYSKLRQTGYKAIKPLGVGMIWKCVISNLNERLQILPAQGSSVVGHH